MLDAETELALVNAIGAEDLDAVRALTAQLPPSALDQVDDDLTLLAYAVDVVADSYVQSGVEIELDIVETLLAAGADPDLSVGKRFLSARAVARRSGQERLIRLFDAVPPSSEDGVHS